MSNEQKSEHDQDQPKVYQEDGDTLLRGPVVDQSALHGILKKIRNLGMPLLSVNTVDPDPATKTNTDLVKGDV
jgi:hypothetical protein